MKHTKSVVLALTFILLAILTACQSSTKPGITVLSPEGKEVFVAGKTIPFSWQWSGSNDDRPLRPAIYLYSVDQKEIIYGSLSDIDYKPGIDIQRGDFSALSYYRVVDGQPDSYPPGFIPGGRYQIKISEYPEGTNNPDYPTNPPGSDYSGIFTIVVP